MTIKKLTKEQHMYCKQLIKKRIDELEISIREVERNTGVSRVSLSRYLRTDGVRTKIDTIFKVFTFLQLPSEKIFKEMAIGGVPNVDYFVTLHGMFYAGDVFRNYISYGKKTIQCMRFVHDIEKASCYKTRQEAKKTASRIKNAVIVKRTVEEEGVIAWN